MKISKNVWEKIITVAISFLTSLATVLGVG